MPSTSLSRRNFLELTALGSAVVPRGASAAHGEVGPPTAAERPLRLDTGPETRILFLDLRETEEITDLEQVVNPGRKHPANPVLSPRPGKWDASRAKYPCVLY